MRNLGFTEILNQAMKRKKRYKKLRKKVREEFPHYENMARVIALAGDRKVEWRPDFIKRAGGFRAEMHFECFDIDTHLPVSTTVWYTYNGSRSKGDVEGSSGTLYLKAKFLVFTWKIKAWAKKTKNIVIFYY